MTNFVLAIIKSTFKTVTSILGSTLKTIPVCATILFLVVGCTAVVQADELDNLSAEHRTTLVQVCSTYVRLLNFQKKEYNSIEMLVFVTLFLMEEAEIMGLDASHLMQTCTKVVKLQG